MPTPSGERSVADAIKEGTPFLDASGITGRVYHRSACEFRCRCGLGVRLTELAVEMAQLILDYGHPSER